MKKENKIIGIVGGVGPYAGLDLNRKIFDQTLAESDQAHLSVILVSASRGIADRTGFLSGNIKENPGFAIADVIRDLEKTGAAVVGIPCNTAHAPGIFDVVCEEIQKAGCRIRLFHMLEETARFIREYYPAVKRVGVLATQGTYRSKVYENCLTAQGLSVALPDEDAQKTVSEAIYEIKRCASPISPHVEKNLKAAIFHLQDKNVEAVILGCTEIPLAIREKKLGETVIVDPTLILARVLIQAVASDKLKPWKNGV